MIPFLFKKKDQPTLYDVFEKSGGVKKGELCILLAKSSTGKTKFFSALPEIKLKETT